METMHCVFHRTWYKRNPTWPNGLEPCAGRKTIIARHVTWAEARSLCEVWNKNHSPGRLSRKAEFQAE